MNTPRRFAPVNPPATFPWKHITVEVDGTITVTSSDQFGAKTKPMAKPYTADYLESLVATGFWLEIPA